MKHAAKKAGRRNSSHLRQSLWLLFAVVWLAQCGADDEPVQDFFPEIVVARPGDTLAIFPPPGDTSLILARVNGLALAHDAQSVPTVPSVLANGEFPERLAAWKLARISQGEIAIVLSSSDLRGWRAFVDAAATQVDSLVKLPIPGDVRQRIAEVEVEPGAQLAPLHRIEMVGGRLWAISVGMGDPLTFTIPLQEGEPSIRVLPEGLHNWREGLVVKDIIVLDDRMIVARDIEVLILERLPESG